MGRKGAMADINDQNPKFMDFLFIGLDHGVDSISDEGGPLVPFLMTQIGDHKELHRFVTEMYEEGVNLAEKTLKILFPKPEFALIAFDGYVTWEDKKYDAIFVKAYDKTQDNGFEFCQRYIPKEDSSSGIEPVGNSIYIGKITSLLNI